MKTKDRPAQGIIAEMGRFRIYREYISITRPIYSRNFDKN
jgi:hypothetical protein